MSSHSLDPDPEGLVDPNPARRPPEGARAIAFVGMLVAAVALAVFGIDNQAVRWGVAGGVMIGVLVVIHEFGHFVVARLLGVGTPVFSFGMGPRVWGVRLFDTDFRISLLPIGGYVQMLGADPFGEEDRDAYVDEDRDFMRKSVGRRFLIMLAGPAMNIALPYVLFTALAMLGEPVKDNTIGSVEPRSDAAEAGLRAFDRVVAVDGNPVAVWSDIEDGADPGRETHTLTVERADPARGPTPNSRLDIELPSSLKLRPDGEPQDRTFSWSVDSSAIGVPDPRSPAARAGLRSGDAIVSVDGEELRTWAELSRLLTPDKPHAIERLRLVGPDIDRAKLTLAPDPGYAGFALVPTDSFGLEQVDTYVGKVAKESAAEGAGVLPGDRVMAIDGDPVLSWTHLVTLVGRTTSSDANGEAVVRPLRLSLLRDGDVLTLEFTPKYTRELDGPKARYRPIMGVEAYQSFVGGSQVRRYYTFPQAVVRAHEQVVELLGLFREVLTNVVTLDLHPTEAFGGPVAIFRAAGESADAGIFPFAKVMGMISLSLGVVNLLPIPVLDGGQILFFALEGIRGQPLPLSWRERIQMVAILVLAAFFVVLTFNDVSDWLGHG